MIFAKYNDKHLKIHKIGADDRNLSANRQGAD
jgi:hypothetical protein